ncbi:MAG TPA: endonuclease/exonuclease/phosphatase family protein, partial [Pyrinomonadaceae bacterium]
MKIATWNINGINSRLDHVIRWSAMAKPDVLCLQETKTPDAKFPLMRLHKAGYEHIAVHGEKSY